MSQISHADQCARLAAETGKPGDAPRWSSGLRQLYDNVADEPLPSALGELVARMQTLLEREQ